MSKKNETNSEGNKKNHSEYGCVDDKRNEHVEKKIKWKEDKNVSREVKKKERQVAEFLCVVTIFVKAF